MERLPNQGIALPTVHLLASHGLLNYPDLGGDYARVGIALYGLLSTREDRNLAAPDLRPVLSLRARVASVKTLSPGCAAGYGLAFVAQRPTKVAVLAIGYADGLPRTLTGGQVLLHGCRAPIVGRICMDQTLVDVTEIPAVDPGDVAVLLGTSGQETTTAYDLAQQAGTITNEILSRLGPRLERIVR
ncbi:MAG: alanine racemase C-terminal domain-containing protein [Evtepia sp.]